MTERTFRDPSPNRTLSSSMQTDDPPPVPALPNRFASPTPTQAKPILRPASVEPPQRVFSPPPRSGGRGLSLDRGPGVMPGRKGPDKKAAATAQGVPQAPPPLERGQSRDSVNFSRPMSPQNSPPHSPLNGVAKRSTDLDASTLQQPAKANTAARLQHGEATSIQSSIQEAAARPVKKKKKRTIAKDVGEGSHLATGTSGGRPTGTAVNQTPPKPIASASSTPSPLDTQNPKVSAGKAFDAAPKKKKKRATSVGSNYGSDSDSAVSDRSSSNDRPRPYNTRAAGLLAKQPSIVREDREAEEQEDRFIGARPNGQVPTNEADLTEQVYSFKPGIAARNHKKSASQPAASLSTAKKASLEVPYPGEDAESRATSASAKGARPQSLSPGRAAHFSTHVFDTSEAMKHHPPGRSVSPAKSALKHSPSRGNSPAGFMPGGWNRLHGSAVSEASDTTSIMSDEGLKPGSKKKKQKARVSFDEESVVVGRAASPPTSPETPVLMSPQSKDGQAKVRFGRDKENGDAHGNDQDNVIQPTPALPSFGSVRIRQDDKTTEVPRDQLNSTSISSDRALGGIISHDVARKADTGTTLEQPSSNEPLPPQVTSVEGSGYHSDSEGSLFDELLPAGHTHPPVDKEEAASEPSTIHTQISTDDGPPATTIQTQQDSVPSIAVLPATPGLEDRQSETEDYLGMPGGFPVSTDELSQFATPKAPSNEQPVIDSTPAGLGIAEPEPETAAAQHDTATPAVGEVADSLRHQIVPEKEDESDDTGNSIYSDAEETAPELDGDGFGSINAIIESPATPVISKATPDTPSKPAQPRPMPAPRQESEMPEPASDAGWEQTQAYWSKLSSARKKQLERAAMPGAADGLDVEPRPRRPKKKAAARNSNQSPQTPLPPLSNQDDIDRPSSPRTTAMKKSMRASRASVDASHEPHMRTSMRNNASPKASSKQSNQRNSMPSTMPPVAKTALQNRYRPISAVPMVDYENQPIKASPATRQASSDTPSQPIKKKRPVTGTAPLRRDSTDSESSFKRRRPASSDGRYSMKRSMRGGSVDNRPQSVQGNRASSLNPRGASPTENRRPFSSAGPSMRTSMRGPADSGKPSRPKSPSRFGFGGKNKPKPTTPTSKSRFSSRFDDSSDEEGGTTRTLGSRFVDSSDDEPADLTPIRGIPRKVDEGDSTDLDDSSGPPTPKIPAKSKSVMNKPKPQALEGMSLATGSLRAASEEQPRAALGTGLQAKKAAEKDKKKRSFFGLGSKKRDASPLAISNPTLVGSTNAASPTSSTPPEFASNQPERGALGPASPAASPATASQKSPKLQRRKTPQRFASDSWPLPQGAAADGGKSAAEARPSTSDGPGKRPGLGTRRSTVESQAVSARTGKKKRFPLLRKAFGLHD